MRAVTIIAVLAVAGAIAFGLYTSCNASRVSNNTPAHVREAFETWTAKFGKKYQSPEEKLYRLSVFAQNLAKVEEFNRIYTHRSALNQFSDMAFDEFLAKYTGDLNKKEVSHPDFQVKERSNIDVVAILKQQPSIDWRTKGVVNPIKNQGRCGSCWAFSATSSVESLWAMAGNPLLDLSEQQLVDCSWDYGNMGCNGGLKTQAWLYVKTVGGQELQTDYPYTAQDQSCNFVKSKINASIKGYIQLDEHDCAGLLQSTTQSPVGVSVAVVPAFQAYSSGVFSITNCGTGINHAINVVGYGTDSTTNQNYWIVRNSWGTSWGEQGYIRMDRDVQMPDGLCAICDRVGYPLI